MSIDSTMLPISECWTMSVRVRLPSPRAQYFKCKGKPICLHTSSHDFATIQRASWHSVTCQYLHKRAMAMLPLHSKLNNFCSMAPLLGRPLSAPRQCSPTSLVSRADLHALSSISGLSRQLEGRDQSKHFRNAECLGQP